MMTNLLNQIVEVLKQGSKFLITGHRNPDGDCIASELAVESLLKDMGKETLVLNEDPIASQYKYLLNGRDFYSKIPDDFSPDVAIVLDVGDIERIRYLKNEIKRDCIFINIDHHNSINSPANYNWIDKSASATAEMILELIKAMGFPIGAERARYLYAGILTDTGGFRFSNTSSKVFRHCAELLEEGINARQIYEEVYLQKSPASMELLSLILKTLELTESKKVASIYLIKDMYVRTGTSFPDTEGFINYVSAIKGVEVSLFFLEMEGGIVKVSLRSQDAIDVSKIAALYGGGGHPMAASCKIKGDIFTIKREVIAEVESRLKMNYNKQ